MDWMYDKPWAHETPDYAPTPGKAKTSPRVQRFYVKEECSGSWGVFERFADTSPFHDNPAPDHLRARFSDRNNAIRCRESLEQHYGKWLTTPTSSSELPNEQTEPESNPNGATKMNHSIAVFLVAPERVRAVKCSYEIDADGKPIKLYIFKTTMQDLAKGDIVVVPTETRVGFTCCRVEELDVELDLDTTVQFKWLVGRVDRGEYDKVLAMERSMIDKIKRSEVRKRRAEIADAIFKDNEALRAELQGDTAKVLEAPAQAGGVPSASDPTT